MMVKHLDGGIRVGMLVFEESLLRVVDISVEAVVVDSILPLRGLNVGRLNRTSSNQSLRATSIPFNLDSQIIFLIVKLRLFVCQRNIVFQPL